MKTSASLFLAVFVSLFALSCQLGEVSPEQETEALAIASTSDQELLLTGDFSGSSAHPSTTGKVKVFQNSAGARTLVIENLMVDYGPDLRIYMAEDAKVTNFIEIAKDVKNGTIAYPIPSEVNLQKQNVVTVWCKPFSVSFGSAPLKKP